MPNFSLEASRLTLELALGSGRNPFNTGRYVFLLAQDEGAARMPAEHEFLFRFDSSGKGYYTTHELCQSHGLEGNQWVALHDGIISNETIDDQMTQARFLAYLQTEQSGTILENQTDKTVQDHRIMDEDEESSMDHIDADIDAEEKKSLSDELVNDLNKVMKQAETKTGKKNQKNRLKHESTPWLHSNDNLEVFTSPSKQSSTVSSASVQSVQDEETSESLRAARLQDLESTMSALKPHVGQSFQFLDAIINDSLWKTNRSAEEFPRYLLALLSLTADVNNPILSSEQKQYAKAFAEHAILTFDAPFTKRGKSGEMGLLQRRSLAFSEEFSTGQWVRLYFLMDSGEIPVSDETKRHMLEKLLVLGGTNFYPFITNTTTRSSLLLSGAEGVDAAAIKITREYADSEAKTGLLDTENHIILREGSRYIANFFRGIDQTNTDLQQGLLDYLTRIQQHGMIEFNSIPYAGYSIEGLLNLFECLPDDDPVAMLAGQILDNLFLAHALNTTPDGRGHKPFARRKGQEHHSLHYIGPDDTQAFYASLRGNDEVFPFYYGHSSDERKNGGAKFAVTALTCSKYAARLNELLRASHLENTSYTITKQNDVPYFSHRCPKYQYLLTGGGAQFSTEKQVTASTNTSKVGAMSLFVTDLAGFNRLPRKVIQENGAFIKDKTAKECIARHLTLLLPGAEQLSDSFYLEKKKDTNPCLFYDLAVGASHVHIPNVPNVEPQGTKSTSDRTVGDGEWSLYSVSTNEEGRFLYVLVFNGCLNEKDLGVMMVIPSETSIEDPQELLNEITGKNPLSQLAKGVVWYPNRGESPIKNTAIQYDNYLEVPRYYPVVEVFSSPDPWKLKSLPERADCCIETRQYSNVAAWTSIASPNPSALKHAGISGFFEPIKVTQDHDSQLNEGIGMG